MENSYWDAKEKELFKKLTEEWVKFSTPSKLSKATKKVLTPIGKLVPSKLKSKISEQYQRAADWDIIKKVMEVTRKGYGVLSGELVKRTLTKKRVENRLSKKMGEQIAFKNICQLRSYQIEQCINSNKLKKQLSTILEGALTGAAGFPGLPFNIAFSFLLYFRAVQHIALFYGYDILDDPRELEIASEILINCLNPNLEETGKSTGNFMAKAMFYAEMTSLRNALLKKMSYEELASKGAAHLFYVQIRALANKAAQNGLTKAGEKGIENIFLKKILEQIGRKLPKDAAAKSIPVLGAFVGAGFDTYYMSRIIKGANLQYHKRFLIEKKDRNEMLSSE